MSTGSSDSTVICPESMKGLNLMFINNVQGVSVYYMPKSIDVDDFKQRINKSWIILIVINRFHVHATKQTL